MISAVVLTKNEEKNIERCVKSLSFCDEIILVDDFSSDKTIEVIKEVVPSKDRLKIFKRKLGGDFASQHNFGLSKARNIWVLFIDADEEVSLELAAEVAEATRNDREESGYYIRRIDEFWGRKLKHGETGGVKVLRLGKKGFGNWNREVHEIWQLKGRIGELRNPINHLPHPTVREFLQSVNFYTDLDAQALNSEGKNFSYLRAIINPFGKFLVNYFFKFGFLDGWPGFVYAFMMSFHSLVVRVKQYDLNLPNRNSS